MHDSKLKQSGFCSDNSSHFSRQIEQTVPLAAVQYLSLSAFKKVETLGKTLVPPAGRGLQQQKELSMTLIACIVNEQLAVCHFYHARSQNNAEKIRARVTVRFGGRGWKAAPMFLSSHLLNTCLQQWRDGESALSLKSLLIELLSA